MLGAAPVGALSYGFWTFTQRAAAARRHDGVCCRDRDTVDRERGSASGSLCSQSGAFVATEEWFLAHPVVNSSDSEYRIWLHFRAVALRRLTSTRRSVWGHLLRSQNLILYLTVRHLWIC